MSATGGWCYLYNRADTHVHAVLTGLFTDARTPTLAAVALKSVHFHNKQKLPAAAASEASQQSLLQQEQQQQQA